MKKLILLVLAAVTVPIQAAESDLRCLAKNIYHEARGEPLRGRLAVAQVTLNRQRDTRWRGTVCQVVYQPYQFSWTLDRRRQEPQEFDSWLEALELAERVLQRGYAILRFPATHYHNNTVSPQWAPHLKPVVKIGAHTFYE